MVGGYQEVEVDFTAEQSGAHAFPLPPATAHGLRIHDSVRLQVKDRMKAAPCASARGSFARKELSAN